MKTEVVSGFLPDVDTSDWETPEIWGKYTALVAAEDTQSLTGRILDQAALKEIFGPV